MSNNKFNKLKAFQVELPQEVLDYYNIQGHDDFEAYYDSSIQLPVAVDDWLFNAPTEELEKQREFTLACLLIYGPDSVQVREKKYKIKLVATGQHLAWVHLQGGDVYFSYDYENWFTKEELEQVGMLEALESDLFEVTED